MRGFMSSMYKSYKALKEIEGTPFLPMKILLKK